MSTVTRNHHTPATPAGPDRTTPAAAASTTGGTLVAPPPKLRRRPMLVIASIAAICSGGLLGVWAYTATSSSHEVVAVRTTINRGEVIDRADLMVVRVSLDPALNPVPATQLDSLVGQRAAVDLPAGGLVTPEAATQTALPGKGTSIVGISLPGGLLPGQPLQTGDTVRIVATPGQQGEVTDGEQRAIPATVVATVPDEQSGQTVVSVQVPHEQAAELAARAATGKVALVLDSRER